MAGPLAKGYRILDLSERSPAAAVAGMVLADLGAEVIRVEPEGGDPMSACRVARMVARTKERHYRPRRGRDRPMAAAARIRRRDSDYRAALERQAGRPA